MSKVCVRLIDGGTKPSPKQVATFIGAKSYKRWTKIVAFIDKNYPEVFEPDWLFGGVKYGWGLRYKKSKSFCTLIPEKGQFRILIVFGGEERAKVEVILPELISHAREDYVAAKTYADGKWLGLLVDSEKVLSDVERMLSIKRKPKRV